MAQCTFEPQQPLVADSFKNCEGNYNCFGKFLSLAEHWKCSRAFSFTSLYVKNQHHSPGLSRIAFMDGNGVVMLGKVVSVVAKQEIAKKK